MSPSATVWTLRSIRCRTNRTARLTAHRHVLSLKKSLIFLFSILFLIVICFVQSVLRIIFQLSILIMNFFLYVLLEMSSSRIRAFQIAHCICARHVSEMIRKIIFFLFKTLYLRLFRLIFPAACIMRQNAHVNYVSCMMGSHAMLCRKSSTR